MTQQTPTAVPSTLNVLGSAPIPEQFSGATASAPDWPELAAMVQHASRSGWTTSELAAVAVALGNDVVQPILVDHGISSSTAALWTSVAGSLAAGVYAVVRTWLKTHSLRAALEALSTPPARG